MLEYRQGTLDAKIPDEFPKQSLVRFEQHPFGHTQCVHFRLTHRLRIHFVSVVYPVPAICPSMFALLSEKTQPRNPATHPLGPE